MTQEHRRRLWGASRACAPKNRETYAFISFYHIFHKKIWIPPIFLTSLCQGSRVPKKTLCNYLDVKPLINRSSRIFSSGSQVLCLQKKFLVKVVSLNAAL